MLGGDHANTLAYLRAGALPATPTRLIALAVIGLIFGGIAFLANAVVAIVCGYASITEPPRDVPAPPPPLQPVALRPYTGDPVAVDGLANAQRDEIVQGAGERLKLSRDRAEMLDRLLADVGACIFVPSSNFALKEFGKDSAGNDWFITSRGRVVISDFSASFIPDGGPVVRLVRNVLHDGESPARWSAIAIGETLEEIHARLQGRLTPLQAAAILQEFEHVPPDSDAGWDVRPRVMRLALWQHGTLSWAPFNFGAQWVLADGRSIYVSAAPFGVDPLSGAPYAPVVPKPHRLVPGDRGMLAMLCVVALIDAFLAAYLFVGSTMVMRNSSLGLSRQVRYALLKIPATLIGLVVSTWWLMSLRHYAVSSYSTGAFASWYVIASLGFPAIVVLVLHSRRAQHFLSAGGQDPWVDLRLLMARMRMTLLSGRGQMLAVAAGVSGLLHLMLWFCCVSVWETSGLQIMFHVIGATLSMLMAGLVVHRRARAGVPLRPMAGSLLVVLLLLCAASRQPMAPWAAQETLDRARSPDREQALRAVRQLASAGETGQELILQLLEGPEPPIGIDTIIVAVGEQWSESDVRWPAAQGTRTLRLSLEWIESIQRTRNPAGIALLEAMGNAPELEPLLRPLLISDEEAIRSRAARVLLTINPRPLGVIGLLRRQLSETPDGRARESIVAALVLLRPASDPALARILKGTDRAMADYTLAGMLSQLNPRPFSSELLAELQEFPAADNPKLQSASVDLLSRDRKGRTMLIELSLGDSRAGSMARRALERLWPGIEPLYWRLANSQDLDVCRDAARSILLVLNESDGSMRRVEELRAEADPDSEQSLQARLVAASGDYGSRLGPKSYEAIRRHVEPGSYSAVPRASWSVTPLTFGATARQKPGLPMWISTTLLIVTLLLPAIVIARTYPRVM